MENKKIFIRCRGIIVDEGELLLVRHVKGSFFALPGGALERGEEVMECMSRELVEELGVKPEIGRLLYLSRFYNDEQGVFPNRFSHSDTNQSVEFFFEVLNAKDYRKLDGLTRTHQHEIEEVRWVKPSDEVYILPVGLGEDFKNNSLFSDQVRYIN